MTSDLNENALAGAWAELGSTWSIIPAELVVTDEGIKWVKDRLAADPEFASAVVARCKADPEYAAFLASVGIEVAHGD